MNAKSLSALLCAIFCLSGAQAHELGQHPAVLVQRMNAGIDANTFIVRHPAGLALRGGHANAEHPAVAMARQAKSAINANEFIVQPPASVTWAQGPVSNTDVQMSKLAD